MRNYIDKQIRILINDLIFEKIKIILITLSLGCQQINQPKAATFL